MLPPKISVLPWPTVYSKSLEDRCEPCDSLLPGGKSKQAEKQLRQSLSPHSSYPNLLNKSQAGWCSLPSRARLCKHYLQPEWCEKELTHQFARSTPGWGDGEKKKWWHSLRGRFSHFVFKPLLLFGCLICLGVAWSPVGQWIELLEMVKGYDLSPGHGPSLLLYLFISLPLLPHCGVTLVFVCVPLDDNHVRA